MIKLALDTMGGDLGYPAMVEGAVMAANEGLQVILVGNEAILKEELNKYPKNPNLSIHHASEMIEMEEEPVMAYKKKREASISVATKLVKDGLADAVVSAGSTGAQMTAAIFVLGRLKGITRPAIVTYYPTPNGVKILLDAGSTPDCDKENLHQFASMAAVFGKHYLKMEKTSVGLLNIGSEEKKGSVLYKETHQVLKEDKNLNFVGNIEGRDIPKGIVDIVVCDGFVGNVVLKLMEGLTETLICKIKTTIYSKLKYKIGGLFLKSAFKEIKSGLDYSEYGGAPLLGVKGLSIICHGSSDAKTMRQSLFAAKKAVDSGFQSEMTAYFEGGTVE